MAITQAAQVAIKHKTEKDLYDARKIIEEKIPYISNK